MSEFFVRQSAPKVILLCLLVIVFISVLFKNAFFPTQLKSQKEISEIRVKHMADNLPSMAIDIKVLGNGWCVFKINGKKFMYHKETYTYEGYESLSQIQ